MGVVNVNLPILIGIIYEIFHLKNRNPNFFNHRTIRTHIHKFETPSLSE